MSKQEGFNAIKAKSTELSESLGRIKDSMSLEELRGFKGRAAASYCSVFDDLILNQKDMFFFHGRNKRPPRDRVNCLLSFLYTILANNIMNALEGVGLDAYVGFFSSRSTREGIIGIRYDGGIAAGYGRSIGSIDD